MRSRHVAAIAAAFVLCSSPLGAQDARARWNEFRGPNGSGVADRCRPPVVIDVEKPAWKIDVPPGYSSPVLSAKLIFLTAVEGDRLATLAFDRQTGQRVWHALAPKVPIERVHETSSPAASTPCVDGDRVYVYFGSYGLLCYDVRGHLVWKKPIPTPKSSYGMATSPIIHHACIYLICDGGILSAVDAHNGKVIYRKRLRAAGPNRAAPVVADDRLYLISERGMVSVVRAGDTFALLHQQSLGEQVAATPAVDESTIYIRTAKHLLAFRRRTRE